MAPRVQTFACCLLRKALRTSMRAGRYFLILAKNVVDLTNLRMNFTFSFSILLLMWFGLDIHGTLRWTILLLLGTLCNASLLKFFLWIVLMLLSIIFSLSYGAFGKIAMIVFLRGRSLCLIRCTSWRRLYLLPDRWWRTSNLSLLIWIRTWTIPLLMWCICRGTL